MAGSRPTLPLVILYPDVVFYPLMQVIERFKDAFELIRQHELTDENRPLVEGIVGIPGGRAAVTGEEIMSSFPNLRVISKTSTGFEDVDLDAATRRGIRVGNVPAISNSTADFAFALLMASARNVIQADAKVRKPDFKMHSITDWLATDVHGATLGIVGLGSIGTGLAKRAQGFDMRILYHGPRRKVDAEQKFGVSYCSELKDLLKLSDFVVLCAPLNPQTRRLISAKELSQMKPSATLINVARGGLINQDDLVAALENDVIHGAAMDVTDPEPLPHDHPLLALPNVIVTPHVATSTYGTRAQYAEKACLNIVAGLKGEQLPYPVNFTDHSKI